MSLDTLIHDPKFWVASSFVIFMGLFIRFIAPFIARGLDGRAAKIEAELAEAKRLREEAAAVLSSYKQKEVEALRDAEELLKHAREEAARLQQQAEQSLKESVERRMAQANDKIARAEAEAVEKIRAEIVETAIIAARKVIGAELASSKNDPALEKAIANIGRIVH